jgi:hypothetical protein
LHEDTIPLGEPNDLVLGRRQRGTREPTRNLVHPPVQAESDQELVGGKDGISLGRRDGSGPGRAATPERGERDDRQEEDGIL